MKGGGRERKRSEIEPEKASGREGGTLLDQRRRRVRAAGRVEH